MLRHRFRLRPGSLALAVLILSAAFACVAPSAGASAGYGELDCNGQSPLQTSIHPSMACTDVRGFANESNANTWNARFYDNGEYIGHDEPDITFLSNRARTGDNVTWTTTIPRDPTAAPTATNPGHDVNHWFELSVAPWYSMALCDPKSYPQNSCTPESNSNAPTCVGLNTTNCYAGGGSAFMEMQLYPPGMPPFADSISCDDSHWCAALTIDSLECTTGYTSCNGGCEEPANFAWIQRNGVPSGPPGPEASTLASYTPNSQTLLMNPGDTIRIRMFDGPIPGGGDAFEVVIDDLTTSQIGYMQASARNGFADVSMANCQQSAFNFQPEYSSAARANVIPWAALQTNISAEFETGHWESCTSVSNPGTYPLGSVFDTYYNTCSGPYETAGGGESTEPSDAFCYPQGDTHGGLSQPDQATGCLDDLYQNGDLDFDGNPYYAGSWPVGASPTATQPGSFVFQPPITIGGGYEQDFIQTDVALSESTCSGVGTQGCSVPPSGPGNFYPYWSRVGQGLRCTLEFGNVVSGPNVNDMGADAQYGTDQIATLGYPEFEGPVQNNACPSGG